MTRYDKLTDMLDAIREKERKLAYMAEVWEDGTDECAMAVNDPSDQYVLGEEIEQDWKAFKAFKAYVNARIEG